MKLIRVAAATAILAALAGCVTSEQIDAGANTFKGQHYQTAFKRLGFPDQERKIAGHTVYSWLNQNSGSYTVPTYNTATTYVGGQAIYTQVQGSRTESYDYHCKLDLVVDSKGIVIETKVDGNIGGCERYAALAPKKARTP
ncbi:hypothetical protein [Agrobacterium tumefaciens]|uniref:hypothetical protein n=1 Tax=Agrobacterium tumefaciens TaxID=358 RepID=UPI001572E375|nr:hypothetical protein [Agrobacterium tumefaciens]WCJ63920.1 hypothetical protein G6M15_06960 [Agrobacterium tumefaciens]